jgi:hypothetical protein
VKDLHRRALSAIKDLGEDVRVEVIRQRKHTVLALSRPGVAIRHLTMSSSPKNEDHTILRVVRDARKALNLEKP